MGASGGMRYAAHANRGKALSAAGQAATGELSRSVAMELAAAAAVVAVTAILVAVPPPDR